MKSFKEFIEESIKIDKDRLVVDYKTNDKLSQTTKLGKGNFNPYVKKTKFLYNIPVYSVYPFSGDDYNEIYKAIKRKNRISIDDENYTSFLNRTAQFICYKILDKNPVDLILTPQSSSFFVDDLLLYISKKRPNIKYVSTAFKKNKINDVKLDFKNVDVKDETKVSIEKTFSKLKATSDYLEAKLIPKQFLQFFSNLYSIDNTVSSKIKNKNIAILDDSITSAVTMKNFIETVNQYEPKNIIGITVFKSK